ncbi:MAG: hypothetical protein Ct9H300mP1_25300 [Planctomycetaceae bacterium]|nr:MAG: hypothetical protein Ct9H300mP1_25300 [Planctomycetaceae bacterium]
MPTRYGLGRSKSAHLLAQKSPYSGLCRSLSTNLERLSELLSARKARTSAGLGSRPITRR